MKIERIQALSMWGPVRVNIAAAVPVYSHIETFLKKILCDCHNSDEINYLLE